MVSESQVIIGHTSPALALSPYLSPMGAPIAHSAPQGQCAGAPEETHTPITSSSTHELPLITMGEHGAFVSVV
ncbi:5'-3' exoribonuclease 2 [Dissostichus eleginoides]|uniref:5'-3' exoribonuclease 2 n=1 Tax=Dissostichus eleginoides TaxID=100907 RepID=A0AAD9C9F2_DISEL|nr:5'-3' exoribonuclease 2 [Dissostichus eleginoides]